MIRQKQTIQTTIPLKINDPLNPRQNFQSTNRKQYKIRVAHQDIKLGLRTSIMGIVNCTPDSFSQDGCFHRGSSKRIEKAIRLARRHIREGADILDIGGESTRPGAKQVSALEEKQRVIPVIDHLARTVHIPISIDTYKSDVAKAALDAGASIVNNVQGTPPDKELLKVVKSYDACIVLIHILGTPRMMQQNIHYTNLIKNIKESLQNSVEKCLEIGIKSDKIILDPGIGFGKSVEDNLKIINRLGEFHTLKKPLLIGTSRKSFIGKTLNCHVKDRLLGTAATVSASILNGAHIVRVHDVKETKIIVDMTDAICFEQIPTTLEGVA